MSSVNSRPAITTWSEDEIAFRDAVKSFAESEIKPHVTSMDEHAKMKPEIVSKLFEMGLMGIESPEQFGGAGTTFTMACIAIEEIAKIDGSTHKTIEKVENFRRRLMIVEKFRRRSGRIRGQIKLQMILMSLIYAGIFAINYFMFSLKDYKGLVMLSLAFYLAGMITVLSIGRRIRWNI